MKGISKRHNPYPFAITGAHFTMNHFIIQSFECGVVLNDAI